MSDLKCRCKGNNPECIQCFGTGIISEVLEISDVGVVKKDVLSGPIFLKNLKPQIAKRLEHDSLRPIKNYELRHATGKQIKKEEAVEAALKKEAEVLTKFREYSYFNREIKYYYNSYLKRSERRNLKEFPKKWKRINDISRAGYGKLRAIIEGELSEYLSIKNSRKLRVKSSKRFYEDMLIAYIIKYGGTQTRFKTINEHAKFLISELAELYDFEMKLIYSGKIHDVRRIK